MTKIVCIFFTLIILFASGFSDDSAEETELFVFDDIFKSIPTLFEYLLQMVEERPEILETNDIALMKRDIELNNCDRDKCHHVKREVAPKMLHSYDNNDKAASEPVQVIDSVSNNVEIYRKIYAIHKTECDNRKEITTLQSYPKLGHISSNLKKRNSKMNDKTKRYSYYEVCFKSLYNVYNKINVDNIPYNANSTKLDANQNNNASRSIDKTQYNSIKKVISNNSEKDFANTNKPDSDNAVININKKGEEYGRQDRYKKLASDYNNYPLTPEDVEEHFLKVDQMLEEYKRNQTMYIKQLTNT